MLGNALKNSPVMNPDGSTGIRLHVDVGNDPIYAGDEFVIQGGPDLVRGGEAIFETCTAPDGVTQYPEGTCVPPADQFPGYAVVGWKSGFRAIRDQPLDATTLAPITESACLASPSTCRRRFDENRRNTFYNALFGHLSAHQKWLRADGTLSHIVVSGTTATVTTFAAHGLSPLGTVYVSGATGDPDLNGTYSVASVGPGPSPTTFTFTIPTTKVVTPGTYNNRKLGVGNGTPRTTSGQGDLPGGDHYISLAGFDSVTFRGTDFLQASTWLHELAHNWDLLHGGGLALATLPNAQPPNSSRTTRPWETTYTRQPG
jgi:hypothetical protein